MVNSMENNNKKNKTSRSTLKKQNILQAILILVLIIVFNLLSSMVFFRLDLTKEKRFSITDTSKKILDDLEDKIIIDVYLEGDDLPVELLRYQKTVKEFLDNFKSYSNKI